MKPHDFPFRGCIQIEGEGWKTWPDMEECSVSVRSARGRAIAVGWPEKVPGLMEALAETIGASFRDITRIESLEKEVMLLKNRVAVLERQAPVQVRIESLAPEPYEIIKPFHVVVRVQDGECIASFFDARISASGDTQEEAVFNLKDTVVSVFDILSGRPEGDLGPGPAHQKKVLQDFIRRKD